MRGLASGEWQFEPKLDRWRATVAVDANRVTVRTRTGRDITRSVPELATVPRWLRDRDAVLDGELVVGTGSASDFYRLGPRLARRAAAGCTVTFVAFDLVWLDGRDTCRLPYGERRRLLEGLHLDAGCWRTAESFDGDPLDLLIACENLDIEGIVAKRVAGIYRPGERSTDWVKVKTPSWRERHAPRRHEH